MLDHSYQANADMFWNYIMGINMPIQLSIVYYRLNNALAAAILRQKLPYITIFYYANKHARETNFSIFLQLIGNHGQWQMVLHAAEYNHNSAFINEELLHIS